MTEVIFGTIFNIVLQKIKNSQASRSCNAHILVSDQYWFCSRTVNIKLLHTVILGKQNNIFFSFCFASFRFIHRIPFICVARSVSRAQTCIYTLIFNRN